MKKVTIAIVVLLGTAMIFWNQEPSFSPPGPDHLDSAPRVKETRPYRRNGGIKSFLSSFTSKQASRKHHEVRTFDPYGFLSVSGRVYHSTLQEVFSNGVEKKLTIILLLGPGVLKDHFIENLPISRNTYGYKTGELPDGLNHVELRIFNPEPELSALRPGDFLSIKGEYGDSSHKSGLSTSIPKDHLFLVEPIQWAMSDGGINLKVPKKRGKPIGAYLDLEYFNLSKMDDQRFSKALKRLGDRGQQLRKSSKDQDVHPIDRTQQHREGQDIYEQRIKMASLLRSYMKPKDEVRVYLKLGESIKKEWMKNGKKSYLEYTLTGNIRTFHSDYPKISLQGKGKFMFQGSGSSLGSYISDNRTTVLSWSDDRVTLLSTSIDYEDP
jgi:hypothetical protein